MNAGSLRHRVTIQQRAATQDGFGEPSDTWTDIATVWANVQPLRGEERFTAQQMQAAIDHKVTMRYRAPLSAQNRLMFGARILDIESVVNIDERNRTLEVFCKEAP